MTVTVSSGIASLAISISSSRVRRVAGSCMLPGSSSHSVLGMSGTRQGLRTNDRLDHLVTGAAISLSGLTRAVNSEIVVFRPYSYAQAPFERRICRSRVPDQIVHL